MYVYLQCIYTHAHISINKTIFIYMSYIYIYTHIQLIHTPTHTYPVSRHDIFLRHGKIVPFTYVYKNIFVYSSSIRIHVTICMIIYICIYMNIDVHVYLCIYVYICIYIYINKYACIFWYAYMCAREYKHTFSNACLCMWKMIYIVCIHAIYMCIHAEMNMILQIHVYIIYIMYISYSIDLCIYHICIYICIRAFICTYIHTHKNMHIYTHIYIYIRTYEETSN